MFIVTNREVFENETRPDKAFGPRINPMGPNELRLAEARRVGNAWRVRVLPDRIDDSMAAEVGLPLPSTQPDPAPFASRYVARKVHQRLQAASNGGQHRNLLLFVHGFNNDMPAVLARAELLEQTYGVEVLVFSWPANGGGFKGVLSYKSDKRDALASTGALARSFERLLEIVDEIHAEHVRLIEDEATRRFGDDAERWDRFFTASATELCPFRISLMLHSMGVYVFKHLLRSSTYRSDRLVFDNIVLASADTNNEGHADWVDRIQCRGRVYITLNEHDSTLAASRLKFGEQQKARLGHWPHRLDARQAVYVDFTDEPHITDAHTYFEGQPLRNRAVRRFFNGAFNGEFAERALSFDLGRNVYRFVR